MWWKRAHVLQVFSLGRLPFVDSSIDSSLPGLAAPPLVDQRVDGCSGWLQDCFMSSNQGKTINMMNVCCPVKVLLSKQLPHKKKSLKLHPAESNPPPIEKPQPNPPSAPPSSRLCDGAIGNPCTAPPGPSCSRGRGRCVAATGGLLRSWTAAGQTGRCSGGESGCRLGPPCQRSTPLSDSPRQTCERQVFHC